MTTPRAEYDLLATRSTPRNASFVSAVGAVYGVKKRGGGQIFVVNKGGIGANGQGGGRGSMLFERHARYHGLLRREPERLVSWPKGTFAAKLRVIVLCMWWVIRPEKRHFFPFFWQVQVCYSKMRFHRFRVTCRVITINPYRFLLGGAGKSQ